MKRPTLLKAMTACLTPVLAICALLQAAPAEDGQDAPSPAEIAKVSFVKDGKLDLEGAVDHFEDLYRSDSSISEAKLIVTRPRQTRTMEMKIWTKGKDKALIVIQAPRRDKGTATLKVDDNLWNYLPKIRRTIRIPPSMMLASWMGSDFTNDDLARESSYTEDYDYELVGRSEDPEGWLVRFIAKPDVVGLWNSFEVVLNDEGTIPLLSRYYDRKDRLSRKMYFTEVKEFDGRRIPAHMTLIPEDEDKEGHKTEMIYLDIEFDVEVPDSTFSLSRLERLR